MNDFLTAMEQRRSIYAIEKRSPIPDSRIEELIRRAVRHTPSAFNMQSSRAMLLLGREHDRFWRIAVEAVRAAAPADAFAAAEEKLRTFAAGYGTVLYFDDTAVTGRFAEQYALYRENFPVWAQQANGMLQFAVWTLLEQEGLGATLQHYNPLVDEEVRRTWELPSSWKLAAQMPFGTPAAQPEPKEFADIDGLFLVRQ